MRYGSTTGWGGPGPINVRLCTPYFSPCISLANLYERKVSPPRRGVDVCPGTPACLLRALCELGDPFAPLSAAFFLAVAVDLAGGGSTAPFLFGQTFFAGRASLQPLHIPLCPLLSVKYAIVVFVQLVVSIGPGTIKASCS